MPIQRLVANCGIFEPEDLSFLQSIFDESCAVHEHLGEEQSTAIARKLFVLFKGGTRDRELLKITISRAFGGAVPSPRRASRDPAFSRIAKVTDAFFVCGADAANVFRP